MSSQIYGNPGSTQPFSKPNLSQLPKKPIIIYDLSIMNNQNEIMSHEINELSMVSSSSQGTIQYNIEETNRNTIETNINNNNAAILIRDNYVVTEEKKEESKEKPLKKRGACGTLNCRIRKSKELEKNEKPELNKLDFLYKNELYNINQGTTQIKPSTLYKVSDYLDQNEAGEPDSNPSNSTRYDETYTKKFENAKPTLQKDKCAIF